MAEPKKLLAGEQIGASRGARYFHDAGFRDRNVIVMLAIADAESDRFERAEHQNDDGTIDRGWVQINSQFVDTGLITVEDCFDAAASARFAYSLFQRRDRSFTAWAAYTSGRWEEERHLLTATRGLANMFRDEFSLPRLKEP